MKKERRNSDEKDEMRMKEELLQTDTKLIERKQEKNIYIKNINNKMNKGNIILHIKNL